MMMKIVLKIWTTFEINERISELIPVINYFLQIKYCRPDQESGQFDTREKKKLCI